MNDHTHRADRRFGSPMRSRRLRSRLRGVCIALAATAATTTLVVACTDDAALTEGDCCREEARDATAVDAARPSPLDGDGRTIDAGSDSPNDANTSADGSDDVVDTECPPYEEFAAAGGRRCAPAWLRCEAPQCANPCVDCPTLVCYEALPGSPSRWQLASAVACPCGNSPPSCFDAATCGKDPSCR